MFGEEDKEITEDSLFDGEVICCQHRNGYRFSLDAVLAAHFSPPSKGADVLDLGAGCGIISLILMYRWRDKLAKVRGIEFQPQLQKLAEKNYRLNGYETKCRCILGNIDDVLSYLPPESFTQVICNPPFYHVQNGRQSRGEESRLARHQIGGNIQQFTAAAASLVKNGGVTVFIYPAEQLSELVAALTASRLELKIMQFIYSYPGHFGGAKLVLVKCIKNGGPGVQILPPFYIYSAKNGQYSGEMATLYDLNSNFHYSQ